MDAASVKVDGDFESTVRNLFAKISPKKIVETGTHRGAGTTTIITNSMEENKLYNYQFISIEVNVELAAAAMALHSKNKNVDIRIGLSLPRNLLPTREELTDRFVNNRVNGIYYDWDSNSIVDNYQHEINFDCEDDMLGKVMRELNYEPDFVLLDSAGSLGFEEFNYWRSLQKKSCYLMLDDIFHCKHHESWYMIKNSDNFDVIGESKERHGFGLAYYKYNG